MVYKMVDEEHLNNNIGEREIHWRAPDGSFTKYILQPGTGFHSPLEWSMCQMNISFLNHSSVLDIGYPTGENVEIHLGTGCGIHSKLMDKCITSMKEGEICKISTEYLDPSKEEEVFHLHLISFQNSTEIWKLNTEQKMDRARHLKTQGTTMFKDKKVEIAFQKFSQALKYLILIYMYPESTLSDNVIAEYRLMKCHCYLNIAACQMKYKRWDHVISNCDKALGVDPCNIKGLYRRAVALSESEEFVSSLDDIDRGLALEPQNKAFLTLRKEIKDKDKHCSKALADGLSKMFTD